jgi:hypothetical protein
MVLPPLELFSLRKELPCCRAALSVFEGSGLGLCRFAIQVGRRFGPLLSTCFAKPRICGVDTLKHGVGGATMGACGRFIFWRLLAGFFDNLLRDGPRGNLERLVKLVGSNHDSGSAEAEGITRSGLLNPALDSRTLQHLVNLPSLFRSVALAEWRLPCVLGREIVFFAAVGVDRLTAGVIWINGAGPSRSQRAIWASWRFIRGAWFTETAVPHLVTQNLLRCLSEIGEIGCEFLQFSVADLAVVLREPLPILCRVALHEQQYSGFTLRGYQDKIS